MSRERKCFTITWRIENFSLLFGYISSPECTADTMEGTDWRIELFVCSGSIGFYLFRSCNDFGPDKIEVECEFSLITCDGSTQRSTERYRKFFHEGSMIISKAIPIDLMRDKTILWPQDILTVQIRLWRTDEALQEDRNCFARTRLRGQKVKFVKEIERFSCIEPEQEIALPSESPLAQEHEVSIAVLVNRDGDILLKVNSYISFFNCEVFFLDASRNQEDCGRLMFCERNCCLKLAFSKEQLMKEKEKYLPNDTLTLQCVLAFGTRMEWHRIEENDIESVQEKKGEQPAEG